MNKKKTLLLIASLLILSTGCSNINQNDIEENNNTIKEELTEVQKEEPTDEEKLDTIMEQYKSKQPTKWGESVDGVINNANTEEKVIALTLDACGGKNGDGYDEELINYLIQNDIPATLFINHRWIESNKETFVKLVDNPIFEIENHGYSHKPLSVTPNSIYGINGTGSVEEVINEIMLNEKAIYELTGKKTKYFRSGTAYYDEVATEIANELGYKIIGYSINGDGGATFSKSQIENSVSKSKSGDIIICHFNQPQKHTYEGLKDTLLQLKEEGYEFVKLKDLNL